MNETRRTNRDSYGGWTGKQFEATGFFRTEHDDKRWWLVTPEGNAFISFGINHYHRNWWAQDYNRDHWLREFAAEEPDDPAWIKGFREMVSRDMEHLGLNTLGIHSDQIVLTTPDPILPYVALFDPVDIPHYKVTKPENFPDIFAPEFDALCDRRARELVEPLADDPFVLGFSMTDCPIFTDLDAQGRGMTVHGAPRPDQPTWPKLLRNLDADAPGKQAYVCTMRKLHGDDVAAFNTTYAADFASWDALAAAVDWRLETDYENEIELRDNKEFLRECVDTYYHKAKDALRRYDTNHMFFGDKINANSDTLNTVLDITSQYTDLVFYQMYGRYEKQREILDRWTARVGKPFLNGDSSFSFTSKMMPHPHGPHAKDQTERAEWTREFVESAFARSDFVGWHICGIIDTWKTMAGKADRQHAGLMTPTGEFYPEMEQTVHGLSARLYEIALGE